MRQSLLFPGLALAALLLAAPALGAPTVEIVQQPAMETPAAYPGSAPGEMRSWVQLVWDPVARQLKRVSYTALDPIPSLGLELQWRPDDPAAATSGPLSGKGTLVFRVPGAPAYDPTANVASYRGSFVDGRAEGQGLWLDRSGYGYDGEWQDGLMHGEGRLQLANGDEYVGSFTLGRREGRGLYIDATGALYDGGFANGQREGEGLFVPARGEPYRADWLDGNEIAGSREAVLGELPWPRIVNAQFDEVPGLRVGVVAERRPHNFALDIEPMSYTSRSDGARLDIFPDDARLMDVWRGGASINLTDQEQVAFSNVSMGFTPSFLGNFERFEPLSLVFELENITTDPVAVVGGFLEVATSATQPEPAMQMRSDREQECGAGLWYRPSAFLDNYGWGAAENATLSYAFGSINSGEKIDTIFEQPLGSVTESLKLDFSEALTSLGVNTALVGTDSFACTDRRDRRLCLGELKQDGRYGRLGEVVTLNDSIVEAGISGVLDYDWTGPDGTVHHKTAPFSSALQLGHVSLDAECGEGGEIVPVRHEPFELRLDESNYRIAIPFSGEVTPGFTTRWRIELQAPKTSEHDFTLVLLLSDGRQVASRPVHLTYFYPPVREITPELLGSMLGG